MSNALIEAWMRNAGTDEVAVDPIVSTLLAVLLRTGAASAKVVGVDEIAFAEGLDEPVVVHTEAAKAKLRMLGARLAILMTPENESPPLYGGRLIGSLKMGALGAEAELVLENTPSDVGFRLLRIHR